MTTSHIRLCHIDNIVDRILDWATGLLTGTLTIHRKQRPSSFRGTSTTSPRYSSSTRDPLSKVTYPFRTFRYGTDYSGSSVHSTEQSTRESSYSIVDSPVYSRPTPTRSLSTEKGCRSSSVRSVILWAFVTLTPQIFTCTETRVISMGAPVTVVKPSLTL